MGSEGARDPLKGVDWKAVGGEMQQNPSVQPPIKKRLPMKVREIPDYYFLPRWPLSSALLFCGACVAGGVAAGMLVEAWVNKKVKGIHLFMLSLLIESFRFIHTETKPSNQFITY